ncbi:MAG TPA: BrnT family toxin [Candidatus Saccharimonadales bacterium]|nr:BrnT family toxin [Candidatus Saccharimonadales bacterium]
MGNITFDWNASKALSNKKKHGVSFEEAKSAFYDENALVIHDPEHSDHEDRFVLMGRSKTTGLLVVCHCYREQGSMIRIISARKATKKESSQYYGGSS